MTPFLLGQGRFFYNTEGVKKKLKSLAMIKYFSLERST